MLCPNVSCLKVLCQEELPEVVKSDGTVSEVVESKVAMSEGAVFMVVMSECVI